MKEPYLIAKDIYKSYDDIQAVSGVSFQIPQGEVFGLLGPNGAGKTTLISILTGLFEPSQGNVVIDGEDLKQNKLHAQTKIGFVPQELALYPTLSARDNLLFYGRIYGLRGKHLRERVASVLELVDLTERANDAIDTYSGGMKRRINMAVGLLHEPELLFLDEPTVGIDSQSRNAIYESVQALNKMGMTIVYTTHYMEAAERLCHRVAIIDKGKLIALDTPQSLIRNLGGGLVLLKLHPRRFSAITEQGKQIPAVKDITQQDGKLVIHAYQVQHALVGILEIASKIGARIKAVEVLEPNLEAVFLQMTGKKLRNN
ncbi:MAG: hypothetical protein B6I38_08645 [Anaerolineaceae bacterium 4572_5.1]|nr:MAG: hypothetical protein B6I38_08645 [Anaerolineaceae bacterium 4572_5.1]RLD10858.1 MAG: export ABC transporter ATP-binding protein [Chloroflexota bacterium]